MCHYTSDLSNIFRAASSAEGCMVSYQKERHALDCLTAASGQLKLFICMNKVPEDCFFSWSTRNSFIQVFGVLQLYTATAQLYGFLLGLSDLGL